MQVLCERTIDLKKRIVEAAMYQRLVSEINRKSHDLSDIFICVSQIWQSCIMFQAIQRKKP